MPTASDVREVAGASPPPLSTPRPSCASCASPGRRPGRSATRGRGGRARRARDRASGIPSPNMSTKASTSSGSNWLPAWRADLADRLVVAHRPLVGAILDHRVVGVREGHDPGPERDLPAAQAERIALPAEALVVVEHDRHRVLDRRRLLQDDLADAGMLDDRLPLLRGEGGRLLEDLLGEGELPDVVEEGRDPQPVEVGVGQAESATEEDGKGRDQRRRLAAVGRVGDERLDEGLLRGRSGRAARPRRRAPAPRARSGPAGPGRPRRAPRRGRPGCGRAPWPSTSRRPRRARAPPRGASARRPSPRRSRR